MRLTTHNRGCDVHVTPRYNGGCRLAQGPVQILLDADELANLKEWIADYDVRD